MRTIEYLTGPEASLFLPAVLAGAAVALVCGALSVFVVLRRLAFIGHGVSHAAFGGVGVAAYFGVAAASQAGDPAGTIAYFGLVGGFCLAAALAIGWLSDRRGAGAVREDTIIGMTLVASMALGALLLHAAARSGGGGGRGSGGGAGGAASLEGSLFGSILSVGPADAAAAWAVAVAIGAVLWLARRPIIFWAFDEPAARAFGVETLRVRLLLMALLGIAIVAAMKLAGVILTTALLVMPGAIALKLSHRLSTVFVLSIVASLVGVLGGLVVSFEMDWPSGPSVVVVLAGLMAGAWAAGKVESGKWK